MNNNYIISVKQMSGCTEKIQELNDELRSYNDMLLTSDHSLNIVRTNICKYVRYLNICYSQQAEIKVQELRPTGGIILLHIKSGSPRKATVTIRMITKVL